MKYFLIPIVLALLTCCVPAAPPPGVFVLNRDIAVRGYLTSEAADFIENNLERGEGLSVDISDGDTSALIRVARHLDAVDARVELFFCFGRCDDIILIGSGKAKLPSFFASDGVQHSPQTEQFYREQGVDPRLVQCIRNVVGEGVPETRTPEELIESYDAKAQATRPGTQIVFLSSQVVEPLAPGRYPSILWYGPEDVEDRTRIREVLVELRNSKQTWVGTLAECGIDAGASR